MISSSSPYFFFSSVLLRYLFKCHVSECACLTCYVALIIQSICNKENLKTKKLGFFKFIFFCVSLYILNSSYSFIDDRPVFCKFNQTLVFLLFLLYTYIKLLSSIFLFLSLSLFICPLIEIHR
jgi:hypothetical protein